MKYWFGYLTAAIFGAITWVLMRFGERFSTLVDMVYPYVIRTSESILAQWASGVDFPIWQLLAVALGALILASIVLMIVLFVLSIALVIAGWKMTGQLAGLGIMLAGVAALLAVLALYNAPYQD